MKLTPDMAAFLLEVLNTPGLSLPLADTGKLRLAADTREALAQLSDPQGSLRLVPSPIQLSNTD